MCLGVRHKLCLPANPHETFLDQLISAEPDGEFQEKRKRFLNAIVAEGYAIVTATCSGELSLIHNNSALGSVAA